MAHAEGWALMVNANVEGIADDDCEADCEELPDADAESDADAEADGDLVLSAERDALA